MNKKLPYISISAKDNYEFGFLLGKKMALKIHRRIMQNREMYKKMGGNFEKMVKDAEKFIPAIKKKFPHLLEEIKGMSDGASVRKRHLLALNCEEELLDYFIAHCTSIAVKTKNNHLLIGHNEDWLQDYSKNGMYVIKGKIKNHSFLALSFVGQLVGTSCALNGKGLGYTVNSLDFKKFRYGIPRNFLLRRLLELDTLRQAEYVILTPRRSLCANTLFVWKDMTMEDIEALYRHAEIYHGNTWLIHTNHPLHHHDQTKDNTAKESIKRYRRVQEILLKAHKPGIATIKKILRDHKVGICGHINSQHPVFGATIASAIMNPLQGWMMVSHGNPCKNNFYKYRLR